MMRKRLFQKICTMMVLLSMVLGQTVNVFAEDTETGTPRVILGGESAFTVEPGKTSTIALQVKNRGTGNADDVYVSAKADAGAPFRVSLQGGGTVGSLGVNGYKNISASVNFNDKVTDASYTFTLEYTYTNSSGSTMTGSDTVYLKMKGFDSEPSFMLSDTSLSPESLSPGNSANLTGKVVNNGGQDMTDVEISLDNLTAEGISLTGGFSSVHVSKIPVTGETSFTFPLVAAADLAAGNYPVTIKLKFKDQYGKSVEKTQSYFVNVGGVAGQKSQIEVINMKEPGGVYGVNENFTVQFDLHNSGKIEAKNIVVTAEGVDPAAVVPKSGSVKTVPALGAGATTSMSFTFAGTAAAVSQNYAIKFTVEYTSGGTTVASIKQFAGVNISNPEKDEKNESKPKIIVSKYNSDPLIVMAGEEFDLNMTLTNTHKDKGVKNIKMFLTLAEETSSESQKSGNIFTPVNSSNTFYFDSIAPKGNVDKSLRLYVVPEAQPKTYTLTVNFEYEDAAGKEYTGKELLGINVKQVTELQVDNFEIPPMVEAYMPISVSFGYFNSGKTKLSNVMIKVEGDVECQNKSTYIGNMDTGASDYFETNFTPNTPGEVPVAIVISYEDATGESKEERREFVLNVTEPMMPEGEDGMNPENPPVDMKKVMIGISFMALLAMALFIFVKRQKADVKNSFGEATTEDLDDEEDDDDDEEGMSV